MKAKTSNSREKKTHIYVHICNVLATIETKWSERDTINMPLLCKEM